MWRIPIVVCLAIACGRAQAPEREAAAAPAAAATKPVGSLVGWWRSDGLCLEIFANGDFELSKMPDYGAKQQAIGAATIAADGSSVKLQVQRIWTARFVTKCRKHNYNGHWDESMSALGGEIKPGGTLELSIHRKGDDLIEVCATECATLHRETSKLGGRWRRASMEFPDKPERAWAKGDLLELDITDVGYGSHLWTGKDAKTFDCRYGTIAVRYVEADRFAVELAIDGGGKQQLAARRLAGEKLELCDADKHCATLERQFDSYHYELY